MAAGENGAAYPSLWLKRTGEVLDQHRRIGAVDIAAGPRVLLVKGFIVPTGPRFVGRIVVISVKPLRDIPPCVIFILRAPVFSFVLGTDERAEKKSDRDCAEECCQFAGRHGVFVSRCIGASWRRLANGGTNRELCSPDWQCLTKSKRFSIGWTK